MELKLMDRLLLAALGLSLLGTGVGLLVIQTASAKVRQPTVDLRWAGENYQDIRGETAELARAGTYTEVAFEHK